MSAHAPGCSCKKCRSVRKARFPNGCLLCFVRPRLPDVRHCAQCGSAAERKKAETRERIQRFQHADDQTLRRERVTAGTSMAAHARMLGHA